ncbi:NAD(P)H-binding protein [Staphylococcus canis]|uniref:NAD(P)H-binding protein n=1 Tax=Staphylococcus canis TaxID=2724942 RepID=A0ABS0T5F2_9STAP|nr:NAD(P)H-binding protein [Staphylococcus canis]MBI5973979.1 NAD(P)H-binding protein [Staphylococcus canis]
MHAKVLLAGVTGPIGQSLVNALASEYQLFTISKYPKPQKQTNVKWITGDIYNYKDVLKAMENIDIAVFFLDPTKHSAKMTRALARELNLIAADNFARAAHHHNITEIIYVSGSQFDAETIQQLSAYGTPVRQTMREMKRSHISVEFQVAKYNDIRIVHHMPKPLNWSLYEVIERFVSWISNAKGTRLLAEIEHEYIKIYKKSNGKLRATLKVEHIDANLYRLVMVKDDLARHMETPIIEFRYIAQLNWIIIQFFNYIPKVIWPVAYLLQVPYLMMLLRGFDTKCRIQVYHEKIQRGMKVNYTKD